MVHTSIPAEGEREETLQIMMSLIAVATVVNKGPKDGSTDHVERHLSANFLWLICMLHDYELHQV